MAQLGNADSLRNNLTLDYTPGCTVQREGPPCTLAAHWQQIGLTPDAIRFDERKALLPRAPRTQGGFRQYSESEVETVAFIRRVQGLGFKLNEIKSLLSLGSSHLQPCAPVRRRLRAKLVDVRRKLADLQKLEHELRVALRSCDRD